MVTFWFNKTFSKNNTKEQLKMRNKEINNKRASSVK